MLSWAHSCHREQVKNNLVPLMNLMPEWTGKLISFVKSSEYTLSLSLLFRDHSFQRKFELDSLSGHWGMIYLQYIMLVSNYCKICCKMQLVTAVAVCKGSILWRLFLPIFLHFKHNELTNCEVMESSAAHHNLQPTVFITKNWKHKISIHLHIRE